MWVRMCGVQWERGVWEKGVKWFWVGDKGGGCESSGLEIVSRFVGYNWGLMDDGCWISIVFLADTGFAAEKVHDENGGTI